MPSNKYISPPMVFYVVVFYIFASYLWWSFLLTEKNTMAFETLAQKEQLLFNMQNQLALDNPTYYSTVHYQELDAKFNRQKWMIRSEGLVFMLLLALGAWQLMRTFSKEIALARQQNNFLLSITHELKSPMASIKLSLQTITRRGGLEEKFNNLATNAISDVDRLETLVDNILLAAKIEARSYTYTFEDVDLSEFVNNLVIKAQQYYGDNWHFESRIRTNVWMKMDPVSFTSAVWNLLENSVKYSGESRNIIVSLSLSEGMAHITVADNGVGIVDEEKRKVFDKFYRVGNELTRTAKGTGLGLFIVKRVTNNHKGDVTVENNTPSGSVFVIKVPAMLKAVKIAAQPKLED
jgi:signal transduction histidine kinase